MRTSYFISSLTTILFVFGILYAQTDDILIDDFEHKGASGWKIKGDAFGEGPVWGDLKKRMNVADFEGYSYVTSYQGGDGSTGSMASQTFTVERDFINFLVSGGEFAGKTCVNLKVKGKVVRTATGLNTDKDTSETLNWISWDVKDLRGEKAKIQIVDQKKGRWGHISVDHIFQSDTEIEIVENEEQNFTFKKKYLNLPVDEKAVSRHIRVVVNGEIVREFDIKLGTDDPSYWVYLEVDEFMGQEATVRIDKLNVKNRSGFDAIYQDESFPGEDVIYTEKHRPQIHFSSKRGWNNDPNGLMYYDGQYYMFYQHNPYGWDWGNMTWGYAVSKDLVHWKELGDELHPDKLGAMFSGSGIVDWNNTTGFQTGDEPPLVLIYTSAGYWNRQSKDEPHTQCLAYSNDRGQTWTKYEGNPVQGFIEPGNRDPKVIWWEETQEWVIVLFLSEGRVGFFRSKDLKSWEMQSVIEPFHECPEIIPLAVDGDEANIKWVIYGASGDYFVGQFDGSVFTPESELIRYNYGNAFYAAQTFSDIPEKDGRRIQIGWGRLAIPGMPFNQMMNFPVTLSLHNTDDGVRMFANPVDEIELLHDKTINIENAPLTPGTNPLADVEGDLFHIRAELLVGDADEIAFSIRGVPLVYDNGKSTISCKGETAPCRPTDGKISLEIIVDRVSIETFVNGGEYFMPVGSIPDDNDRSLELTAKGGNAEIVKLEVNKLKSAWE